MNAMYHLVIAITHKQTYIDGFDGSECSRIGFCEWKYDSMTFDIGRGMSKRKVLNESNISYRNSSFVMNPIKIYSHVLWHSHVLWNEQNVVQIFQKCRQNCFFFREIIIFVIYFIQFNLFIRQLFCQYVDLMKCVLLIRVFINSVVDGRRETKMDKAKYIQFGGPNRFCFE